MPLSRSEIMQAAEKEIGEQFPEHRIVSDYTYITGVDFRRWCNYRPMYMVEVKVEDQNGRVSFADVLVCSRCGKTEVIAGRNQNTTQAA